MAVAYREFNATELLLKRHADPMLKTTKEWKSYPEYRPLEIAVSNADRRIATWLIHSGAYVQLSVNLIQTEFRWTVLWGYRDELQRFDRYSNAEDKTAIEEWKKITKNDGEVLTADQLRDLQSRFPTDNHLRLLLAIKLLRSGDEEAASAVYDDLVTTSGTVRGGIKKLWSPKSYTKISIATSVIVFQFIASDINASSAPILMYAKSAIK